MINYNEEANTENGSCIPVIYGCMDPEAFNYDEDANTELDDSCITAVPGCMDPDAANYDSSANIPANENCLYDAGCITGPGEPYWANDYCYSWVIEVDPYCCEVGWDAVCINQYEYCAGQVSSITSHVGQLTYFFPNPTQNIINVEAPTGTVITIYDASGKRVVETQDTRINLPSPGVYVIMANYQGRITKEKIVRQ